MEEKLLKIINNYGIANQLRKFNEESFELQEAILYREHPTDIGRPLRDMSARLNNKVSPDIEHITEEIADVMVMLKQFQYYYEIEDKEIEEVMKFKIERQLNRIKGVDDE